MATVQSLLRTADRLPGDSAERDVEVLLCHVLQKSRTWLYTWPEAQLADSHVQQFESLLSRRAAGEPVAYLTGTRNFWTLSLTVNEHTLIPRPETETLVEWALALDLPFDASVVDLGTGSGAIALALASEQPGWQVTGVDRSGDALAVARQNAEAAGLSRVQFVRSDWYDALPRAQFELIVSNPPYVADGDEHLDKGDVRFEPVGALVAEDDGLGALRSVAGTAPDYLAPGGWLLLEHGHTQGAAVRDLLQSLRFAEIETRTDLAGCERITGGRWRAE